MPSCPRFFAAMSISLLVIGSVISASAQWAEWTAQVSGPDVFGNTKVIAVVPAQDRTELVVQCDELDELALALTFPATKTEIDDSSQPGNQIPATLLVKVDSGKVEKFDAVVQAWNDTRVGVVVTGRSPEVVSLLHAIGAATSVINVGTEVNGNRQSEAFSAAGSSAAMNTVIKNCKLTNAATAPSSDSGSGN